MEYNKENIMKHIEDNKYQFHIRKKSGMKVENEVNELFLLDNGVTIVDMNPSLFKFMAMPPKHGRYMFIYPDEVLPDDFDPIVYNSGGDFYYEMPIYEVPSVGKVRMGSMLHGTSMSIKDALIWGLAIGRIPYYDEYLEVDEHLNDYYISLLNFTEITVGKFLILPDEDDEDIKEKMRSDDQPTKALKLLAEYAPYDDKEFFMGKVKEMLTSRETAETMQYFRHKDDYNYMTAAENAYWHKLWFDYLEENVIDTEHEKETLDEVRDIVYPWTKLTEEEGKGTKEEREENEELSRMNYVIHKVITLQSEVIGQYPEKDKEIIDKVNNDTKYNIKKEDMMEIMRNVVEKYGKKES